MPTLETYEGAYLWNYVPSLPLAATFAGIFTLATALHCVKLYKTRHWFTIPFLMGGFSEIIGYVSRAASTYNTGNLATYLIQDIFLVIPPLGFAATLYATYSRIVRAIHGEAFSPVPIRWATWIFVVGDLTCFSVQGNAAGLLGNPDLALTGDYIIIAGLILQIIVFVFFITCCVIFNKRMRVHMAKTGTVFNLPWQSWFTMLYMTSAATLIRNIYRVVEFVMQAIDQEGYLLTNEWPLYVFDAALMLFVMTSFYIWYPNTLRAQIRESMTELRSNST
ncbi:RTA1 like protein-domain-containing protein [Talaromyces proteolyticus]|uniref:RTA1 like protein-domain-containing protein n=1 Tax=Talaromyces proteolyticus TaxID=1131652 RepID=A0AAD4KK58_9EURO|nr:RTA1 like protein-domain-containing protein [Talaromyces proteolyticus]KAH8692878.1 RTA1 like protein-domain-containing protein [Talaromyces proteolyticus]